MASLIFRSNSCVQNSYRTRLYSYPIRPTAQSTSFFRFLPSFRRSFHATPSSNETYKTRRARATKRDNLSKRQANEQLSQQDKPDPVLGHSKTPAGYELWEKSDLCRILATPDNIFSASSRETLDKAGSIPLPSRFNFGIKPDVQDLIFKALPEVSSQQAFMKSNKQQFDASSEEHTRALGELEAKATIGAIHLSRLADLRNASAAGIAVENRRRCIEEFSLPEKPNDTGRSEVQAAILTAQIRTLHAHLQQHTHDIHNHRSIRILVHKRAKVLRYLKETKLDRYAAILPRLGLEARAVEGELIV